MPELGVRPQGRQAAAGGGLFKCSGYRVRRMRPRFVVVLAVAAGLAGLFQFVVAFAPQGAGELAWIGPLLDNSGARMWPAVYGLLCWVGAWGLWRLRRWGRNLAMAYLVFVLASFLLWGIRAGSDHELAYVMGWQMFVLPFVVFCLMYLYNGERYFD